MNICISITSHVIRTTTVVLWPLSGQFVCTCLFADCLAWCIHTHLRMLSSNALETLRSVKLMGHPLKKLAAHYHSTVCTSSAPQTSRSVVYFVLFLSLSLHMKFTLLTWGGLDLNSCMSTFFALTFNSRDRLFSAHTLPCRTLKHRKQTQNIYRIQWKLLLLNKQREVRLVRWNFQYTHAAAKLFWFAVFSASIKFFPQCYYL